MEYQEGDRRVVENGKMYVINQSGVRLPEIILEDEYLDCLGISCDMAPQGVALLGWLAREGYQVWWEFDLCLVRRCMDTLMSTECQFECEYD